MHKRNQLYDESEIEPVEIEVNNKYQNDKLQQIKEPKPTMRRVSKKEKEAERFFENSENIVDAVLEEEVKEDV